MEPDPAAAAARARELEERAYVVDLAWLRSTPWRERVAATFDPRPLRPELGQISSVTARHRPDSVITGVLFFGWLASRLGWEPGHIMRQSNSLVGHAHGRRQDVKLRLEPDPTMNAPGLAGITIETAAGTEISLNRGPGGLTARRRNRKGNETTWTVLGASRGEGGILGEGIRQALLRDPTYAPALKAAAPCFRERVPGRRVRAGAACSRRSPSTRSCPTARPARWWRPSGNVEWLCLPRFDSPWCSAPSSTATRAGSASVPRTWPCRPTAATSRARWCSRRAGAPAAAGSSCATCC